MEIENNGISSLRSNHSVEVTIERLRTILQVKGVKLFAVIDHSGEAEQVGLKMPPTKLLIFGNPAAGTPIMIAAPTSAIDLPLKILVWQDYQNQVWLSFTEPAYLQQRHQIPESLMSNISVVGNLATNAAA